jgi:hypothetical protein
LSISWRQLDSLFVPSNFTSSPVISEHSHIRFIFICTVKVLVWLQDDECDARVAADDGTAAANVET